jgi:transcriptional regulator with XRE-family HTH domain
MDKKPVGRPTDYRPEFCEQIIEFGKKGYSESQVAAEFGVTRKTLNNWEAEHPDFLYSSGVYRELAQSWWESLAQNQMLAPTPGFSSGLWSKSMAARFRDDYTERSKTDITTGGEKLSLDINLVRK